MKLACICLLFIFISNNDIMNSFLKMEVSMPFTVYLGMAHMSHFCCVSIDIVGEISQRKIFEKYGNQYG